MIGRKGDMLVMDRKGPQNSIRMRVVRAQDADEPQADVHIVPHPWRPTPGGIIEELRAKKARLPENSVEEAASATVDYLNTRYGSDEMLSVNERAVFDCVRDYLWDAS